MVGDKYILILYDYDSNAILTAPLTQRTGGAILAAYKELYEFLKSRGMTPKLQQLDNEVP